MASGTTEGGAGVWNTGTIGALSNSGVIAGGVGGSGLTPGAAGDAIYSAGANASIGPIANSGQIIGNVEIDNQSSVTITGGKGKTYGSWTGGRSRSETAIWFSPAATPRLATTSSSTAGPAQ